ncbi:MAG: cytochrome ubiquinol oxidase subunit I [Gemmatimonadaceae bacterium]
MSNLMAARAQMGMSLAFHIVFAAIGVAMPVLMVIAEHRWQKTGDVTYLDLAKRWARGTAVLFAVGAVSGTVLSFELGLLWPGFMRFAGPIVGLPFSLEGFAFFTEAIFLGVFLYGRDRIPPRAHLWAGIIVALSGAASAVFVVMVNAWMNAPVGFTLVDGHLTAIDPLRGMRSPAAFQQVLHMVLATYAATGLGVAGVHAWMLRTHPTSRLHRAAMAIALSVGAPAALLQPLSGDLSARVVAETQPAKLAAMEAHFTTMRGAPLHIGGWPDEARAETRWSLEIPRGLSLLAFHDPAAEVKGLRDIPRDEWPPVAPVHLAFQVMVGLGTAMALVSLWAGLTWWGSRGGDAWTVRSPALLRALAIVAPFGFICIEAGWMVTEIGRQPWVVQGLLRTADAVTPMPGLVVPFTLFTLLYLLLGAIVVALITSQVRETREVRT